MSPRAIYSVMPEKEYSQISTDDCLRLVLQGERDAFEVVVRRYERSLRSWLAVHAPPGIDVDEIAQQAFVAVFSRLDEYELDSNFAAWLFTVARYQLKTETTRLRRVADYHTRYAPQLLQRELERIDHEPPELWLDRAESLKLCLETLSDRLRQFVDWRYREEIPLEEMANRSGRSVAAIKKQLWKIRQKLQYCIEKRIAATQGGVS